MENIDKKTQKCKSNHSTLVYFKDLSKIKRLNTKDHQCLCVDCGEFIRIKDINDSNHNIIYTNKKEDEIMSEYFTVRSKYFAYIVDGMTPEEATVKINDEYKSKDQEEVKVLRKTTNN